MPDFLGSDAKTILEQLHELGHDQLSEILSKTDLKGFCSWASKHVSGVARFGALKIGGSMQYAGEFLENDSAPRLGDDEGASTCLRCLVHAVISQNHHFQTWLKRKELEKLDAAYVTQADRVRIIRAIQTGWMAKVDEVWSERRKTDDASRWDESVEKGFRPTRTVLGIEEALCEGGCRLLRAIAHALDPKVVDYPKGEFKMRVRKDFSNVTLLYVDEFGSIVRNTGISFRPGNVAVFEADVEAAASSSTDPLPQPLRPDGTQHTCINTYTHKYTRTLEPVTELQFAQCILQWNLLCLDTLPIRPPDVQNFEPCVFEELHSVHSGFVQVGAPLVTMEFRAVVIAESSHAFRRVLSIAAHSRRGLMHSTGTRGHTAILYGLGGR
jgi:hypothetical protein